MGRDWRCARCGKLLGVVDGERIHIRFARGHEYLVGLPTTSVCRSCGALNELRNPLETAVDTVSQAQKS